jgi:hypothetical protein
MRYVHGNPVLFLDAMGLVPPQIAGLVAGCLVGGLVTGLYDYWFGSGNAAISTCKGGVGCIAGGIAGAISGFAPQVAPCVISLATAAIASLSSVICEFQPLPNLCDIAAALMTGVMGCVLNLKYGGLIDSNSEAAAIAGAVAMLGLVSNVVGVSLDGICRGIRDGMKLPPRQLPVIE